MTGPHLTPEREAEIRRTLLRGEAGTTYSAREVAKGVFQEIPDSARPALSERQKDIRELLAALDAERAAHAQTRAVLEASTELLIQSRSRFFGDGLAWERIDAQVQANQVALGLVRPAPETT